MEKIMPVLKKAGGVLAVLFKKLGKWLLAMMKNKVGRIVLIVLLAACVAGAVWLGVALTPDEGVQVESQTVSFGLENVGELATQAAYYTNVNVIEDDKKWGNWSVPLTKSKCIFTYDGVIKAGYDFAKVQVEVDEIAKRVTVTLPEAKILSNEIKPDSLKVYDEHQSIFTPLSITDVNTAQEELKETAKENAVANGLFEAARENMELLIKGLLSGYIDFAVYELVIQ